MKKKPSPTKGVKPRSRNIGGVWLTIHKRSSIAWVGVETVSKLGREINYESIPPRTARELASWLLRFAAWSDSRTSVADSRRGGRK